MIDINLNLPIDTTPTNGSTNLIDSNAVFDGLATKIAKHDGTTYDTNAIQTVTAAEYAAIGTPNASTIYFIV